MQYVSTRGHSSGQRFCDILLEGLAPDGGLYLPASYPRVDDATLTRWRACRTPNWRSRSCRCTSTTSRRPICVPSASAPIPRRSSEPRPSCRCVYWSSKQAAGAAPLYLEALSNGPTLAFKDMAMQLLGNLFEYELARRGETLNILGATSGDTGSAAEYAMRGKKGVSVFMTSPAGRMSPFQQAQMFSLMDDNIHNIAVAGVFDDCQDMVKVVSGDLDFKRRYRIGTVNSINWARLVAQVVYYFAGYFQATRANDEQVRFTVPSGNFGNVCAGHVARMMGLPIDMLVVATNENDVLDEFFRTGVYRVRAAPTRTRPPARRWTSPRHRISSDSCSTCSGVMRRRSRTCSTPAIGAQRRVRPGRPCGVPRRGRHIRLRQRTQHPCRPPGDHPCLLERLRRDGRHRIRQTASRWRWRICIRATR
jgi:threonine synthase